MSRPGARDDGRALGRLPQAVSYSIVYDPTQFVRASIEAVVHTLLEAIALVVLVVILFLQTWRASSFRCWPCRCPSSAPSR
jgi:Cu/Ag efflux pump CusA